jgi:U3 small nucleolar RNA-associated protein 13
VLDITICNKEGTLIAVATNSELIKIYNLNNWSCQLLKGHTDIVICLNSFYKTNDSYLLSSSKDSTIRLWKKEESNDIFQQISIANGHTQDVGSVCFSKLDLKFFASASIDTTIKLWDINKNEINNTYELKVLFTQKAHDKDINSITVSPNDKFLASGSSDRTAKLWDSTNGKCLAVFKGHKRGVWCVQFSLIYQIIATSSADSTIKLWSTTDFSCVKVSFQ